MRTARRIAPALVLTLLGVATAPRTAGAQVFFGNGMNLAAANNGFGGFGPMGMGAAFGPMAMNNANANGFAFGFGGPMNGGMVMFSGNPGMGMNMGFGNGQWFNNNGMAGGMFVPQPQVFNNMGGVAAAIDQTARRPGANLPAVRRRRR